MEQTQTFIELGYRQELVTALAQQEISAPTWVQAQSADAILSGNDVIAQAHTGSGKTLAFVLPLFMRLDAEAKTQQALILAPTHELVMQIHHQVQLLAENSGIALKSVPLIGDANVNKQIERLKLQKPQILIGTPGRVHDLIKKKKVTAHTLQTIILDEADNLLENTNAKTIEAIIKASLKSRQVLVFSATIGEKTMAMAKKLLQSPTIFQQGNIRSAVNPNIEHFYVTCDRREKFATLRKVLAATQPKKALVFINTGDSVDDITEKLNYHHFKTASIYGTLEKEERKAALDAFRDGSVQILISSDLSARGLDIAGITHVFNLDMPLLASEYLHRAGRSARGHAHGTCISIVAENEASFLKKYDRAFDIKLQQKEVREGKIVDRDAARAKKDAKIAAERQAEREAKKVAQQAERANKPIRIYEDDERRPFRPKHDRDDRRGNNDRNNRRPSGRFQDRDDRRGNNDRNDYRPNDRFQGRDDRRGNNDRNDRRPSDRFQGRDDRRGNNDRNDRRPSDRFQGRDDRRGNNDRNDRRPSGRFQDRDDRRGNDRNDRRPSGRFQDRDDRRGNNDRNDRRPSDRFQGRDDRRGNNDRNDRRPSDRFQGRDDRRGNSERQGDSRHFGRRGDDRPRQQAHGESPSRTNFKPQRGNKNSNKVW